MLNSRGRTENIVIVLMDLWQILKMVRSFYSLLIILLSRPSVMLPKHLSPDFYNTRRIKLPEEGIDPDPILTVSGVILGEESRRLLILQYV